MTFPGDGAVELFACLYIVAILTFFIALLVAIFRMAAAQEKMASGLIELSERLPNAIVALARERRAGTPAPSPNIPSPNDLPDGWRQE